MSDLSIYELEDIIWDDFDRNGHHIVPHTNQHHVTEDKNQEDSCKRPRLQTNEDNLYPSSSVSQVKQERDLKTSQETKMMEKDSWGVFTPSGNADTAKDSEICTDDGVLKGDSIGNSYNYTQSHVNQSDVNLFSNDGDDKESSDLLYYSWPDIGNFDDMDRMLSNCDSSFGLNVTGNDDELVWFTSEDPAGNYEQPMKMDLKFPCTETNTSNNNTSQESDNKREFNPKDNNKNYMESNTYLNPPGTMMTGIKYENKGPTCSSSQKETSNKSSQIDPSYGDPLFQFSSQKEICLQETKIESQSEIGEVKKGSLDVPEGSSISSELNEISLEATSFRQLQQVMEQLDLRTKLCIRDSLYRLARSAEQRHNHDPTNCGPLMTDGTNSGFMDMETDTNPIDRTIAHLLFHRPSESFKMPTTTSPLKPNAKGHGVTMVTEKQSCQEARNESDDKVSSSGKN